MIFVTNELDERNWHYDYERDDSFQNEGRRFKMGHIGMHCLASVATSCKVFEEF